LAFGDANETFEDDITFSPPIAIGQPLPFYGNNYSEFGVSISVHFVYNYLKEKNALVSSGTMVSTNV
jgi:hypothetical protein